MNIKKIAHATKKKYGIIFLMRVTSFAAQMEKDLHKAFNKIMILTDYVFHLFWQIIAF